jgi:hypothetical protein
VHRFVRPALTTALALGVAYAGPTLVPAADAPATQTAVTAAAAQTGGGSTPVSPARLGAGQLLVGAAKTSIAPKPGPEDTWETDPAKCRTTEPADFAALQEVAADATDGLANAGSTWPENPDCIYMGGFGLGPTNPVSSFDAELGLWVRSLAMSDGKQTLVLTMLDGEGWLWDYQRKCTDCGAKQIAAALAADPALAARGVTPASHVLHATHSHASPDFIGGWGFVPNWYMEQVADTIRATAKQAVLGMRPAVLEAGEVEARSYNKERRDTYRAAEEQQLSWLRAVAVDGGKKKGAPQVIATLGAYGAHPTQFGTNDGVAHPDWPGLFVKRLEERFGGMGFHFMTGLGNLSASGDKTVMGRALADLVPQVGAGRPVDDTTVRLAQTTTTSAVTNAPLTALGTPGFFDRRFLPTPAAVSAGEGENAPCVSASPQSVELSATAARIGNDLVLTAAPGEVFANYTNTVKEQAAGRIAFPLAQANDALGYMPQSFEINPVGQQGLGFFAGGYAFVNYEDSYAIDRCTGDLMLETTIDLLEGLQPK